MDETILPAVKVGVQDYAVPFLQKVYVQVLVPMFQYLWALIYQKIGNGAAQQPPTTTTIEEEPPKQQPEQPQQQQSAESLSPDTAVPTTTYKDATVSQEHVVKYYPYTDVVTTKEPTPVVAPTKPAVEKEAEKPKQQPVRRQTVGPVTLAYAQYRLADHEKYSVYLIQSVLNETYGKQIEQLKKQQNRSFSVAQQTSAVSYHKISYYLYSMDLDEMDLDDEDDDSVPNGTEVALDLIRDVQSLVLPSHQRLADVLGNTASTGAYVSKAVQQFVSDYVERDLVYYCGKYVEKASSVQYVLLEYQPQQQQGQKAAATGQDQSTATGTLRDRQNEVFAQAVHRIDVYYKYSYTTTGTEIRLTSLLFEPIAQLDTYVRKFGELARVHTDASAYIQAAADRVQKFMKDQQETLEECAYMDKIYNIKRQLELPNLAVSSSSGDGRFLKEARVYRVKSNNKLVGPCESYLFDNMFIVSWTDTSTGRRKKKLIHFVEGTKVVQVSDVANGFYLRDLSNEVIATFKTINAQDYKAVMDHLSQLLVSYVPYPYQLVAPVELEKAALIEKPSELQAHYAPPLEQLYRESYKWKRFMQEDKSTNIEYTTDSYTQRKIIRLATLDKLIEKMTVPNEALDDGSTIYAFLLTYRNLIEPEELLNMLIDRYNTPPPPPPPGPGGRPGDFSKDTVRNFLTKFLFPMRLKLVLLLQHWIQKHSHDFRIPDADSAKELHLAGNKESLLSNVSQKQRLVNKMRAFIEQMAAYKFMVSAAEQLRSALDEAARDGVVAAKAQTGLKGAIAVLKSQATKYLNKLPKPKLSKKLKLLNSLTAKGKKERTPVSSPYSTPPGSPQVKISVTSPTQLLVNADLSHIPASGILDWPSLEIARYLTFFYFSIFERIEPRELLDQAWNKKKEQSPNICAMINFTNNFINFVSLEILRHEKAKDRAHAIGKFIKVALECKRLGNFNAAFEITGALNSVAVHRLKHSWPLIPQKLVDQFKQELESEEAGICCYRRNFKNMRGAIASTHPPLMPYIGLYLTDLVFVDDGNPNVVNGMLNFFKRLKMSTVIQQIQRMYRLGYQFIQVQDLQSIFLDILVNKYMLTMDKLNAFSLKVEPREG